MVRTNILEETSSIFGAHKVTSFARFFAPHFKVWQISYSKNFI